MTVGTPTPPTARLVEPAHQASVGAGEEPPAPTASRRAPGWQGHVLVLLVCLGAVAAALVLQPAPPGGSLSVAGVAMPGFCALRNTTGIPCPGCGLTRSFVEAVRGDLAASLAHHVLGAVLLAYALTQALRHALWLGVASWRGRVEWAGGYLDRGLVVLAVALAVVWIPVLARALSG